MYVLRCLVIGHAFVMLAACGSCNEPPAPTQPQPEPEPPTPSSTEAQPEAPEARPAPPSDRYACVLRRDGRVSCFGRNDRGQLGDGTTRDSDEPVDVLEVSDAISVSAGHDHACAVLREGHVRCWGANGYGQLGTGSLTPEQRPVQVTGLQDARQVSAGYIHNCALRETGEVACWGMGPHGQLGVGDESEDAEDAEEHGDERDPGEWSEVPVPRPFPVLGLSDATAVAVGADHSCALRAGGGMVCWGRNETGLLGDGTTEQRNAPVGITAVAGARQISAARRYTCARADAGVSCWGASEFRLLERRSHPAAVSIRGTADAIDLSVGPDRACAVLASGGITCWNASVYGWSAAGPLAVASPPTEVRQIVPEPAPVAGVTGAFDIAVGNQRACAIVAEGAAPEPTAEPGPARAGRVVCWEGDGAPAPVAGIDDAVAITVPSAT